tara:strand:- start:36133 stop:36432 length:300 start_codon:yes stop_codon:yes gene_type:complete
MATPIKDNRIVLSQEDATSSWTSNEYIGNKYKYYVRMSKGAYITRSGTNKSIEDIEEIINWRFSFLEILEKKVGMKRYLKVYEVYEGKVILNKNEWKIK